MIDSITLEPLQNKDLDNVIKLLSIGLGNPFSKERWLWLHRMNLLAPSLVIVAKDQGAIVGVYSIIKKEIIINNKTYIAGRDIDPVVHPNYQGQGIFSKLLKYREGDFNDISIHINFANKYSEPGFLHNGWKKINIKLLFAPSKPLLRKIYKQIFLRILSRNITTSEINIKSIESFNNFRFFDDLNTNHKDIYIKKTKSYLEWRYLMNPDKQYTFFKAFTRKTDLALIICTENNGKYYLLDIINQSSYNKQQFLKRFLFYYLDSSIKSPLITWNTICDKTNKLMIIGKKGSFLVKNNSHFSDQFVFQNINWELGPGDSEFS